MRRRILIKICFTISLLVAVFAFYHITLQVTSETAEYRRIVIRGTQDLQLLIINKKEINELVLNQEDILFESDDENNLLSPDEENGFPVERFESRQLTVDSHSEEEDEEFYDNSISDWEKNVRQGRFTEAHLKPVISRDVGIPSKHAVHLCVVVCENRATEALTMLKSVAMMTRNVSIVFHIIADTDRQKVMQTQLELWPKVYSQYISYYIYNITIFEGTAWDSWNNLYKPCAVQRLFLPDRLLNIDSLIYVDTDTVFLRSLVDLWSQFELFNSSQLISLVQESEDGTAGWYNRFATHPYYGKYGVNSGVMLMNLTRLRKTNWLSEMQAIYQKYQYQITWGDQDLINIYFSLHPEQLFIMSCEWNYRTDHCMYVSNCKAAEQKGISLLHGSRGSFYNHKEPSFGAVHQAFKDFDLAGNLVLQFIPDLQKRLRGAVPSNCGTNRHQFISQISKLAFQSHPSEAKGISQPHLLSTIIKKQPNKATLMKPSNLSQPGRLRVNLNSHRSVGNLVKKSNVLSSGLKKLPGSLKSPVKYVTNTIKHDSEDIKTVTHIDNQKTAKR